MMKSNTEPFDQRYMDAAHAYCNGQFEKSLATFSELVESGNAMAATYLSNMYLRGEGVPKNVKKGLELLELAASWGDAMAAFNLGALYRTGDCGVPRDFEKSRHFFLLARELGCPLPVENYLKEEHPKSE